ncbi:transposase [Streptomyces sp. NPDC088116]|uniref:transposase n=1 Tax=Streptomyces sp. NPDC088116 TaxID=3365825 RepID=UPI0038148C63
MIDARSVKTSTNVPAREQCCDVGKKIVGRKRSIIIDTTGLKLTVLVTAAGSQYSVAGERLLNRVTADHSGIRKGWADRGCREYLVDNAARLGIAPEVVRHTPGTKGFTALPHRRVIEHTLGRLMHHHRLARDYEALPARSTAMIYIAMIAFIARRIARESTQTWRGE